MPMPNHTTVVIVNYNAGDRLLTCMRSIFESGQQPEIVVVDNASRDGSLEKCRRAYPKLNYIVHSHNLGFATGVNVGIRYALEKGAEVVVLMNPDATIEKKSLHTLVQTCKREDVGIAVPIIYHTKTKEIWFSGGFISFGRQRATHQTSAPVSKALIDTQYATGCVMAIHRDVFRQVGLFDEQFFLYYEDADLSLRVRANGQRVVVVPEALAWHSEDSQKEQNKPQKVYFLVFCGLLFFDKHTTGMMRLWMRLFMIIRRIRSDIRSLFGGDDVTRAVKKAFNDYDDTRKKTNPHIVPYR